MNPHSDYILKQDLQPALKIAIYSRKVELADIDDDTYDYLVRKITDEIVKILEPVQLNSLNSLNRIRGFDFNSMLDMNAILTLTENSNSLMDSIIELVKEVLDEKGDEFMEHHLAPFLVISAVIARVKLAEKLILKLS